MASVSVDSGRVYINAGTSICSLEPGAAAGAGAWHIFQPLDSHTVNNETNGEAKNGDAKHESKSDKTAGKNGDVKPDGIVCIGVSGDYLAVCSERKELTVFHKQKPVSSCTLTRKASKLCFTADHVIIADKNGDVYKFNFKQSQSETNKAELVLGHLSMLLDVALTPDNKHILTADRDEKIRVSQFPNGYNITNFCLGHADFVTSISLLNPELLLSGSGDGTLRVWKFLEGVQIASREVHQDVDVRISRKHAENNDEEMDIDRKRNEPSDLPAVVKVAVVPNTDLVLAQVESCNHLLLYSFTDTEINLQQQIQLQKDCVLLDFGVTASSLFCLAQSAADQTTPTVITLQQFNLNQGVFETGACIDLPSEIRFDSETGGGDLKNLHKRWFDNMKDYMERKQMRMEKARTNAENSAKKQKIS